VEFIAKVMTEIIAAEPAGGDTRRKVLRRLPAESKGANHNNFARGSRQKQVSDARCLTNQVLIDRYRCSDAIANFGLVGRLSDDEGYFRFDRTTCYGQSASGFRAKDTDSNPSDTFADVRFQDSTVWLPFNPNDIVNNLLHERYANHFRLHTLNLGNRWLRDAYYFLRPMMKVGLRRCLQRAYLGDWQSISFPHWPVDTSVDVLSEQMLLLSMRAKGLDRLPFVWFWPDGAQSCVVMTHDVETERGRDFCGELMDIDDAFGIKASIQVVPEGSYDVSSSLVQTIRDRGFELNIQDLNHDGHLYRSREEFLRRVEKINQYGRDYNAKGFRAAVLYRNPDWYDEFDFSFDMSVPNVGHLDPQRGGCCTTMPYFIGDILEIPVTTTQDYMLFHLLNDYSSALWEAQTEIILQKNGLVSFVVHPDYIIEPKARQAYRDLLEFLGNLRQRKKLWVTLAGEVDQWWRLRSAMRVVEDRGTWRIEGAGSERAKLAFARARGDGLEYEIED
jgi:hypothetical protein